MTEQLLFGIKYLLRYWLLNRNAPLICGLVLHNRCNLQCRHCTVIKRPDAKMSYEEAVRVIDYFYAEGGRCLYLEGGEPFIWKDKSHNIEDIIAYGKKRGYHAVIIYTNGTRPLESDADTIFVSVDGLKKTHDNIRGKSFEKIMQHIRSSSHPSLYINFTINAENKDELSDFCEYVHNIPQIKGIFFYFHTPYYGYDDLYIDMETKNEVLIELLKLKSRYRILNSSSGLKSALRNNWKKNLDVWRVYEDGRYYKCCRMNNNGELCKDCGYLSYAEIDQTLKLKPGAVINALKYF